jgi:NADH dehydrogenase FAD-containing subunit
MKPATGVEFSAELHDLIHDDLARHYPTLIPLVSISLYDIAPRILSMFDSALAEYAANHFSRQGIEVHTRRTVTKVEDGVLHLKEEDPVKFGMLVWSTGLETTPLVKGLKGVRKDQKAGRIMTDDYLRVLAPLQDVDIQTGEQEIVKDVYAIGDCSVIDGDELPATAQVASQQGAWLRKRLNLVAKRGLLAPSTSKSIRPYADVDMPVPKSEELEGSKDIEASVGRGFRYHNILTMAYLGSWNAIAQRSKGHGIRGFVISLPLAT